MARPAVSSYTVKNRSKYIGSNLHQVVLRSSWERTAALEFDTNPAILGWSSESISVAYFHPFKQKWTIYKPDFFVVYVDNTGRTHKAMMEVKPRKEAAREFMANPALIGGKNPRATKAMAAILEVNAAKWKAALYYCQKQGWEFVLLTEDEIFQQRMVPSGAKRN